jgi:acetyltransferase-like isoleucine patch superfamily enzyme
MINRLLTKFELLRSKLVNYLYRRKCENVGEGTRFGGSHITIIGGKKGNGSGISIGRNCTIYDYCILVTDDYDEKCGIIIGDNSHFNYGCYLSGTGGLKIGGNCLFGPNVKILTGGHQFMNLHVPIINQGLTRERVIIEDNVWIGAGAIILQNVVISSGAIVAAGSVVSKDVVANTIVAGIPAKIIRNRELIKDVK